jgi:hypothetical protein
VVDGVNVGDHIAKLSWELVSRMTSAFFRISFSALRRAGSRHRECRVDADGRWFKNLADLSLPKGISQTLSKRLLRRFKVAAMTATAVPAADARAT